MTVRDGRCWLTGELTISFVNSYQNANRMSAGCIISSLPAKMTATANDDVDDDNETILLYCVRFIEKNNYVVGREF